MYIAYFDEAGDDGEGQSSSPLFVLSCGYIHYLHWREAFNEVKGLRRELRDTFGLPVKTELHTSKLVLGKNPYRRFELSSSQRIAILEEFLDFVGSLDITFVNVVINKSRIASRPYRVLDKALTYSIQRIENDLDPRRTPANQFIIITDEGRVGAMRKTTRRVQRFNYIPSKFGPDPYRRDIRSLIEDPLPKNSAESYFIQMADAVTFVVYNHMISELGVAPYHNRMPSEVTHDRTRAWLERLKPSLNLQASKHEYGIVCYPK